MRDTLNGLGLWVATAWRAGPVLFLVEAVLALPHVLAPVAQAYGVKLTSTAPFGRAPSSPWWRSGGSSSRWRSWSRSRRR